MPLQRHNEVCDGLVSSLYQTILILHMWEVGLNLRIGAALTLSVTPSCGLCSHHVEVLAPTQSMGLAPDAPKRGLPEGAALPHRGLLQQCSL